MFGAQNSVCKVTSAKVSCGALLGEGRLHRPPFDQCFNTRQCSKSQEGSESRGRTYQPQSHFLNLLVSFHVHDGYIPSHLSFLKRGHWPTFYQCTHSNEQVQRARSGVKESTVRHSNYTGISLQTNGSSGNETKQRLPGSRIYSKMWDRRFW